MRVSYRVLGNMTEGIPGVPSLLEWDLRRGWGGILMRRNRGERVTFSGSVHRKPAASVRPRPRHQRKWGPLFKNWKRHRPGIFKKRLPFLGWNKALFKKKTGLKEGEFEGAIGNDGHEQKVSEGKAVCPRTGSEGKRGTATGTEGRPKRKQKSITLAGGRWLPALVKSGGSAKKSGGGGRLKH